jgi:hypothetical protein
LKESEQLKNLQPSQVLLANVAVLWLKYTFGYTNCETSSKERRREKLKMPTTNNDYYVMVDDFKQDDDDDNDDDDDDDDDDVDAEGSAFDMFSYMVAPMSRRQWCRIVALDCSDFMRWKSVEFSRNSSSSVSIRSIRTSRENGCDGRAPYANEARKLCWEESLREDNVGCTVEEFEPKFLQEQSTKTS